jgi:hypothetical protein
MTDADGPVARIVWPILASVAGAITALSFRPWKDMGPAEIGLALFVGASFAYFVGPWVVQMMKPDDPRMQGAIYYVLASGSNAMIPLAVKKLSIFFGTRPEEGK